MTQDQSAIHIPVLKDEVLEWLQPRPGALYVDGTLGLGGHTQAILERSAPTGRVVGFEWDEEAAAATGRHLADLASGCKSSGLRMRMWSRSLNSLA